MATAKSTETTKQLTCLAGALKAPRILDVAVRLAQPPRALAVPAAERCGPSRRVHNCTAYPVDRSNPSAAASKSLSSSSQAREKIEARPCGRDDTRPQSFRHDKWALTVD